MTFHARTVEACWRLARQEANAYQRRVNQLPQFPTDRRSAMRRSACLAARDAADRIALKIRYGRSRA